MGALPALRNDLIIKEQIVRQEKTFIFKDPAKQSYYRFDEEEYYVFSQLDGEKSAEEIAKAYNEQFDDDLTAKDIQDFIASVRSMDLFERSEQEQNIYLFEKLKEQRRSRIIQAQGSAFYFRLKMWDPERFFNLVVPYIHWIWSRPFVLLMNLFLLSGVMALIMNGKEVKLGLNNILDFMNKDVSSLFFLWATVMGTIMIHEMGHGLTCKRFGGECHEIGFLFMFFNPCMYANVNDAWLFENKNHRLYVTFAGCYVEFLLGVASIYIWMFTQPGSMINTITFQIVVVAFFSAIFMNFNPLMKFDGYFALSDFLEVPNLRDRSKEYVKYLIQTKIFRLNREHDYISKREHWIFIVYGSLMIIYLFNVMLGLGFMVGTMAIQKLGKTVGIPLAIFVIYKLQWRYVTGLIGFIRVVMTEHETYFKKKMVRFFGVVLAFLIVVAFFLLPVTQRHELTGILEPEYNAILRSLADGYVVKLRDANQLVFQKGEVMIRLENNDLDQQVKNHFIDKRKNDMLQQQAIVEENMAEYHKLVKLGAKMAETSRDFERQKNNLTVIAPFTGMLEEKLDTLEYTFVSKGQELGRLIDIRSYQANFDILERDLEGIEPGTTGYLSLKAQPWKLFQGNVTRVSEMHKMQGVARVYQVTVSFPNENLALRPGLEGTVTLVIGKTTLFKKVVRWFKKTIRLDLQI